MRSVHYIGLGAVAASYVYYPKIDKLYCVVEKGVLNPQEYKSISYNAKQAIGGIFMLLILVLFYHTPYVKVIFSLNVFQCVLISIISGVLYRNIVIAAKLENFSKMKLEEIPIEEAIKGHYYTLKNHTNATLNIDITLYLIVVICWIYRFNIFNTTDELDVILLFSLFMLFVIAGIFFAIIDPIGRIKLLSRIRKEKRRLKKEK